MIRGDITWGKLTAQNLIVFIRIRAGQQDFTQVKPETS